MIAVNALTRPLMLASQAMRIPAQFRTMTRPSLVAAQRRAGQGIEVKEASHQFVPSRA